MVTPPPFVTCFLSHVRCQVSGFRCQMSGVRCQVSLVRCILLQRGWASWWRVWYQQGLSRLVCKYYCSNLTRSSCFFFFMFRFLLAFFCFFSSRSLFLATLSRTDVLGLFKSCSRVLGFFGCRARSNASLIFSSFLLTSSFNLKQNNVDFRLNEKVLAFVWCFKVVRSSFFVYLFSALSEWNFVSVLPF